jgi:hypothetical protein
MSKDSNAITFSEYNRQIIKNNLSVDNCKECIDLIYCDSGFICANPNPNTDTCNILLMEFNT